MDISIVSRNGGRMEPWSRVKYLEKIKKTRLRDGHALLEELARCNFNLLYLTLQPLQTL